MTEKTKNMPIEQFMKRNNEMLNYVAYYVWNPNPEIDARLTPEKLYEKFKDITTLKQCKKLLDIRKSIKRIKRAKDPYGLTSIEQIAWSGYHKKPIPFDAIYGKRSRG